MIKDYIEEKLKTNILQFEILNKEYSAVNKDIQELVEHINRIRKDDDIDFIIFSPRGSQYSFHNELVEYSRRLEKLKESKQILREKMNVLLTQKNEFESMMKETPEFINKGGLSGNSKVFNNNMESHSVSLKPAELNSDKQDNTAHIEEHSIIKIDNNKDIIKETMGENKINKVRSNGNTGKYFDALTNKSMNYNMERNSDKELLSKLTYGLGKKVATGKTNNKGIEVKSEKIQEETREYNNKSLNDNKMNRIIQNGEVGLVKNKFESNQSEVKKGIKISNNDVAFNSKEEFLKQVLIKLDLCQKLLKVDKEECSKELMKLKNGLEQLQL